MYLSKKHLIIFFLIIFLFNFFIFLVSAENEYYADITIEVDSSGFVTIEGVTNHPNLLDSATEIYTLKKQSYWLLNITKEENFSYFVYILTFPEGASINYLKSSGSFKITENQGKLVVTAIGENESFSIQSQYQIEKSTEKEFIKFDIIFFILIIFIILSIFIFFIARIFIKQKVKIEELKENGYNFKGLNQRQKQIIQLLIDKKIPLTQTDIQRELNIPKAAVSRNIRGLELKGLVEKEQIGMSNLIRLKKP